MIGLILLLHFGTFTLLALFWQTFGIDALPIMQAPLCARSLSEFWGKRWNLGFRQLSYDLVFGPLYRSLGVGIAGFLVFLVSGLIHDLVISVPARGGYGLPTTYFALQGLGVAIERSSFGKMAGLRGGVRGWLFMGLCTLGPISLLFHHPFVLHVIIPFMEAIHAA
jgi:D-alanyl-lipoteichoic acid acyltransferase DltB (MBOAT superfamily)